MCLDVSCDRDSDKTLGPLLTILFTHVFGCEMSVNFVYRKNRVTHRKIFDGPFVLKAWIRGNVFQERSC